MPRTVQPLLVLMISLISVVIARSQAPTSIYTNLGEKSCRTLKSDVSEGSEYLGSCPGTAGYSLLLAEGDLRQNLTVVTPRHAKHSLELWTVVSSFFSSLGPKAEWRVIKQKAKLTPVALIVRYNANEDTSNPEKITSYLVVSKITAKEICVTDKISSGPKANEEARRLADVSAAKPCLKGP